jgi:hypothetical protein
VLAAFLALAAFIELGRDSQSSYIRVVDGGDDAVVVHVDGASPDMPAMLGTTTRSGKDAIFRPRYAFEPGVRYRVDVVSGGTKTSKVVEIPQQRRVPTTVVEHVYPGSDVLPENQLKFYLHFSAPMSRGELYRNVHLLDQSGKEIEKPFLELGEELWDPSLTRFTLLFDPGRVKRDLAPNREVGAPLVAGRSYTFVVDAALHDGNGQSLREAYRKQFRVVSADRTPPDPAQWRIESAPAGSVTPVAVTFPEALDHALLERSFTVTNTGGTRITGGIAIDDNERRWRFTPNDAWRAGTYSLTIATTLEDLAGNRIGRAFDVDTKATDANRRIPASVTRSFEIR